MVYKQGFIAVIECGGKILRETNVGEQMVILPFMSDYSLLLKNKEARKAQVKVEIDGQDVLNGGSLIVIPNSEVKLEGFMEGNTVRNKFRFIRKTPEIVAHRGDRVDDSVIRVAFCYEQLQPEVARSYIYRYAYPFQCWEPWIYRGPVPIVTWQAIGVDPVVDTWSTSVPASVQVVETACSLDADQISPDEGVTVPGAYTHQEFYPSSVGILESNAHVIIIRLRGAASNSVPVTQPITVKDKLECSSCAAKWPSDHKFCGRCGTALI